MKSELNQGHAIFNLNRLLKQNHKQEISYNKSIGFFFVDILVGIGISLNYISFKIM